MFREPEYSCTVEPITQEDKREVLANAQYDIKAFCIVYSILIGLSMGIIFLCGNTDKELVTYLFISLYTLLLGIVITSLVIFLRAKIGLRDQYKLVEKGTVTSEEIGGDVDAKSYSYIGEHSYPLLPGTIKVGDRVSIEYTLTKENKSNIFIRARKI